MSASKSTSCTSSGKLPRIAYVGAEALTLSHGTGMMFKRHFSAYEPGKFFDIHFQALADQMHFPNVLLKRHDLRYAEWNAPWLNQLNHALAGDSPVPGGSLIYQHYVFDPVQIDWKKFGGPPDLIYSTCFSSRDFAFLHHVYRHLPKRVPIVQHFLDLDLSDYDNLVKIYSEMFPSMCAVWALTENISYAVGKFSFTRPELVQALQQPLMDGFKRKYRDYSDRFDPLVIGNVWSGTAYLSMEKIWKDCQKQIKGLPSIQWAGHPRRLVELEKAGVPFDPNGKIVKDIGFLPEDELPQRLKTADLGIIAFSGETVDREHYTSYSLPSRIGDYCANGLPLVVISRKGTAPWRLVHENNLGIALDPEQHPLSVRTLKYFIQDRKWREECGINARRYAEKHLDLEMYQETLYSRLRGYTKFEVPSADMAKNTSKLCLMAAAMTK
jgi:hypothetical protein